MKAFHPIRGSAVSINATSTSGNVAIPAVAVGATAMRVTFTAGTASARVASGVGNSTAAVSTDPLCPNPGSPWVYAEVFSINESDTYVAAKTDAGTCTVEITFGFGA